MISKEKGKAVQSQKPGTAMVGAFQQNVKKER